MQKDANSQNKQSTFDNSQITPFDTDINEHLLSLRKSKLNLINDLNQSADDEHTDHLEKLKSKGNIMTENEIWR